MDLIRIIELADKYGKQDMRGLGERLNFTMQEIIQFEEINRSSDTAEGTRIMLITWRERGGKNEQLFHALTDVGNAELAAFVIEGTENYSKQFSLSAHASWQDETDKEANSTRGFINHQKSQINSPSVERKTSNQTRNYATPRRFHGEVKKTKGHVSTGKIGSTNHSQKKPSDVVIGKHGKEMNALDFREGTNTSHHAFYVPQIGDEVIYFRQGHEEYITRFIESGEYDNQPEKKYWTTVRTPRDHQVLLVRETQWERAQYGLPTLCHVRLESTDSETSGANQIHFQITYHFMPEMSDFLVLRHIFDHSLAMNWESGDRFRSIEGDTWRTGTVVFRCPFEEEEPGSLFKCLIVEFDDGQCTQRSPWNLITLGLSDEPTNRERSELLEFRYAPKTGEWGAVDCDTCCDRILKCIDQIMHLQISKHFKSPVDLGHSTLVPYPTNLMTIKRRLEQRYYRRLTALQWDVKKIEKDAADVHKNNTDHVRLAAVITQLLLAVIQDDHCDDAIALYKDLRAKGRPTEGVNADLSAEKGDNPGPSNALQNPQLIKAHVALGGSGSRTWKKECEDLLQTLRECQDSRPFHEPVDETEYPDYRDIIDNPMDMTTIKRKLLHDSYKTPAGFARDMKLMFDNAETYTPDEEAMIRVMTRRMTDLFYSQFSKIMKKYKSVRQDDQTERRSRVMKERTNDTEGGTSGPSATCDPETIGQPPQSKQRKSLKNAGKEKSNESLKKEDDGNSSRLRYPVGYLRPRAPDERLKEMIEMNDSDSDSDDFQSSENDTDSETDENSTSAHSSDSNESWTLSDNWNGNFL